MRYGVPVVIAAAVLALQISAPAQAGLINADSTVNIFFSSETSQTYPSQIFSTAVAGPFLLSSLPAPPPLPITGYTAPNAPSPIHSTEAYNLTAEAGFFFTNTQAIIYNNASPPLPFGGLFTTFDFTFTNEDITAVSVDSSSSTDFLPATVTLVGADEFKVVIGDGVDPAYLSTLVIDVTTAGSVTPGVPEPSTWALMLLGFAGLGFAGFRRSREAARA